MWGGKVGLGWDIRRDFWDDCQVLILDLDSGHEEVCSSNRHLFCGDFYICFIFKNKKKTLPDPLPVPWPISFPEGLVPSPFAADVY